MKLGGGFTSYSTNLFYLHYFPLPLQEAHSDFSQQHETCPTSKMKPLQRYNTTPEKSHGEQAEFDLYSIS